MATIKFPKTPAEIKESGEKFFLKHKSLGANSPLRILPEYDFDKLGDTEFVQWNLLNKQADELSEQARLLREKRDNLWLTKIKPPMLAAKKIIAGLSINTPTYSNGFGFDAVKNPTKHEPTIEEIAAAAAKATAKVNAKNLAKEIAKKKDNDTNI